MDSDSNVHKSPQVAVFWTTAEQATPSYPSFLSFHPVPILGSSYMLVTLLHFLELRKQ